MLLKSTKMWRRKGGREGEKGLRCNRKERNEKGDPGKLG